LNRQQPSSRKRKYDQYSEDEDERSFSDSEDEKEKFYVSRQRESRTYRSPRREKRYDNRDRDFEEENKILKDRLAMVEDPRRREDKRSTENKDSYLAEENARLNERLSRMENMMNAQASNQQTIQYSSPQIFQPQQQQQDTPTAPSFNNNAFFQNNANNQSSPSALLTPRQNVPQPQVQTTNTPVIDHSHRVSAYTSRTGIKLTHVSIIREFPLGLPLASSQSG